MTDGLPMNPAGASDRDAPILSARNEKTRLPAARSGKVLGLLGKAPKLPPLAWWGVGAAFLFAVSVAVATLLLPDAPPPPAAMRPAPPRPVAKPQMLESILRDVGAEPTAKADSANARQTFTIDREEQRGAIEALRASPVGQGLQVIDLPQAAEIARAGIKDYGLDGIVNVAVANRSLALKGKAPAGFAPLVERARSVVDERLSFAGFAAIVPIANQVDLDPTPFVRAVIDGPRPMVMIAETGALRGQGSRLIGPWRIEAIKSDQLILITDAEPKVRLSLPLDRPQWTNGRP